MKRISKQEKLLLAVANVRESITNLTHGYQQLVERIITVRLELDDLINHINPRPFKTALEELLREADGTKGCLLIPYYRCRSFTKAEHKAADVGDQAFASVVELCMVRPLNVAIFTKGFTRRIKHLYRVCRPRSVSPNRRVKVVYRFIERLNSETFQVGDLETTSEEVRDMRRAGADTSAILPKYHKLADDFIAQDVKYSKKHGITAKWIKL